MNETEVTTGGLRNVRPGREALTGVNVDPAGTGASGRRRGRKGGAERAMVPEAEFTSYYGLPIINRPVWEGKDIASYLFLGGLAGCSALVAAGAQATRRRRLGRMMKLGAASGAALSSVALVHDLGRRDRFLNMLRTFKPTSPMSVGSWLLAGFGPAAGVAALTDVTGTWPKLGATATAGAAALGGAVSTYTAVLISNTAVPAWHDGRRDLPFVFAASAAASAAGWGLVGSPRAEASPVRTLAVVGGVSELACERRMRERMGMAAGAFEEGKAQRYHNAARPLIAGGVLGALVGRRSRVVSAVAGASLLAGSALTRFAIFEAGLVSADDPRYTVVPQRQRLEARTPQPASTNAQP